MMYRSYVSRLASCTYFWPVRPYLVLTRVPSELRLA